MADKVPRVYLDTQILINHYLIALKGKGARIIDDRQKKDKEILDFFESKKFELVLSFWSILEFRTVLRDILFEIELTRLGYSAREFTQAKREITLPSEVQTEVNETAFLLSAKPNILVVFSINNVVMQTINQLNKRGIEFMDALLFLAADQQECDFFVTQDNPDKIDKVLKDVKFKTKTKVVPPKDFVKRLKRRK